MSVARQNLALTIDIAAGMRDLDGDAAGQRHVALAVEQTLACEVDGDERSRTCRLHTHTWPAKIQLIGHARGQNVFIVPGLSNQKQPGAFHQATVIEQVVHHVGVHAGTGEDADRPGKSLGWVARVFEGLPSAFQEMTMLWVHDRRVSRAEPEERRVEHIDIVKNRGGLHIVGVGRALPA